MAENVSALVGPSPAELINLLSDSQIRFTLSYHEGCVAIEEQSLDYPNLHRSLYPCDYLTDCCYVRMAEKRMSIFPAINKCVYSWMKMPHSSYLCLEFHIKGAQQCLPGWEQTMQKEGAFPQQREQSKMYGALCRKSPPIPKSRSATFNHHFYMKQPGY